MTRRAILLLVCALASACGQDTLPTQSPESTQLAQSTQATSPDASTSTKISVDWTLVNLPDAVGQWSAGGVIANAEGFVVYGGVNDRPAAWTSIDGLTWQSFALPGLPHQGFPAYAAATTTDTVLMGVGGTSQCAHPSREYLWRRRRGDDTWMAVPFVESLFCQGGLPKIAANDSGFAIAGTNAGEIPFAWHSADGLKWQDVSQGLPVDSPPALMTAIDGGFLFLGRGSRTDAEASLDGTNWAAVEAPPAPPAFNPNGGLAMSPELLIDTPHGPMAIYESDDGSAVSGWRRQPDSSWAEVSLAGFEPGALVAGGLAVGNRTYLSLIRAGRGTLVVSDDLATWTAIAVPPLNSFGDLAEFGGRLMLVGSVNDAAGETRWQVWTALDPGAAP